MTHDRVELIKRLRVAKELAATTIRAASIEMATGPIERAGDELDAQTVEQAIDDAIAALEE